MPRPSKDKIQIRKIGVKDSGKGGESFFITLPKELVEQLHWRKGQKVIVTYNKGDKSLLVKTFETK